MAARNNPREGSRSSTGASAPEGKGNVIRFPNLMEPLPTGHTHREVMTKKAFMDYLAALGLRIPEKAEALMGLPKLLYKRESSDSFSSISEAGIECADVAFESLARGDLPKDVGIPSPYGIMVIAQDSGEHLLLVDKKRKIIVKALVRGRFSEPDWEDLISGIEGALRFVKRLEKDKVQVRFVVNRDGENEGIVRG